MDPRDELTQLRKMKRLKELEAKASGPTSSQATVDSGTTPVSQAKSASDPAKPENPLLGYLKKGLNLKSAFQGGLIKGASLGNAKLEDLPGAMGKLYQDTTKENPVASGLGQLAGGVATGSTFGAGAAALAPEAASGASLMSRLGAAGGRVGLNTGAAALQGYLTKPQEGGSRLQNAGTTAMIAGPLAALAEGAGAIGNRTADWTMKQATGIKKDISAAEGASINPETGELQQNLRGVGNKLIDMGVRGSKEGMSEQVSSRLAREEQNLSDLTDQLQGTLSPKHLGDAVSQHAKRFTLPSTGAPIPGDESELETVRGLADKYNSMGDLTPADYLAIKRSGGSAGYTKAGNPGAALSSQIGRSVADAARTRLGTLDPQIIDSLGNEQALVLAKKALQKPGNVQGNPLTSMLFSKVPALAGSYGATGLQTASELATDPRVQQGLFGAANAAQQK